MAIVLPAHLALVASPFTSSRNKRVMLPMCQKNGPGLTYKDAGVDIDAGNELVRRISTMAPGIGGFGGLYSVDDEHYEVVGTDGVGTKLKLAFEMNVHDTIGIDLVAMNVNDIVTSGASPMIFVDQFSCDLLDMEVAEQAIKGVVQGCHQADCTLVGGKVVENPGSYPDGILYEVSGCAVGIVKKGTQIDGSKIQAGDVLIGLPSSGVHSNGFSLVRSILNTSKKSLKDQLPGGSSTIGEALLVPTKIYVREVLDIISKGGVKGIAHITGGGFTDNIPRVLPPNLGVAINVGSWPVPQVFTWLKEAGNVCDEEMFRTFNMGIGMVLVVDQEAADRILRENGPAYLIGKVVEGEGVKYESSDGFIAVKDWNSQSRESTSKMEVDPRTELLSRLAGEPPRLFLIGDEYSVTRAERVDDKLKLALKLGFHDTIGIDLVAVNVNSIVATGARPVSFVDYFSTSHLAVDTAEKVIKGLVEGCRQADCPLRGGETAEMQRFHWEGEYMVNAYTSGRVKKEALIDGSKIAPGDALIGLPSSGVHAHGFPLIYRMLEEAKISLSNELPGTGMTIGEGLLIPTKIYVKQVLEMVSKGVVKGVVDITEGGLKGSIARLLSPRGMGATIQSSSWNIPVIFNHLNQAGNLGQSEMFSTFNMGIGMVVVIDSEAADMILKENAASHLIGKVTVGEVVISL